MFPESPVCTLYDDTKRNGFLSNWGRTRCNRSAQGLKMANCTSFKILTHICVQSILIDLNIVFHSTMQKLLK